MPRLPIPGHDDGTWGSTLNDYLSVEHNPDGTLKQSTAIAAAATDTSVVHNSTNETVAGVKTFSSSPLVPTPTAPTQATNKAYVDSTVSAGAPDATTTTKGLVKLAGDLAGTASLPTVPALATKVQYDAPQTLTVGQQLQARMNVGAVGKDETVIRVNDYASPQAALDAAPAGARVLFQGAYDATSAPFLVKQDRTWIDALGATFVTATWGRPIFDAYGRNDCMFDLGLVTFTGTRGGVGSSYRGSSGYCSGAAVWINGDRNNVRNVHTVGMPCGAVFFSAWNGTYPNAGGTTYDRQGIGNKLGVGGFVEVEGYNFGVLWSWQVDLAIGILYGHDDIDDSSGTNPTHVYYGSSNATYRSTGFSVESARAVRNLTGQPFQMKYTDQGRLGPHSADDSVGLFNVLDCDDLQISVMAGTRCRANAGQGAFTMGYSTAPSKRLRASSISIQLAANVDERAASIWADDAEISRITVEVNHSVSVNTALNLVILRGNRGRVKSSTLRSIGAGHMRGFAAGLGTDVVNGWVIEDPLVLGPRAVVDVRGGSTNVKVRHDPAIQSLTGGGTAVSVLGTPVGGELLLEIPSTASTDIQSFTTSGTWTKPSGAKTVKVVLIAAGGGGGSGRRGAAGTVRCGGGGGGGGGYTSTLFDPADLTSTVSVAIGAAGTAGAAATTDDTSGNTGGTGGSSAFGLYAGTSGGVGGSGGTAASGGGGSAGVGSAVSSTGGTASTTGGAAGNAAAAGGPGGGGSGGGITTANAASNGGVGQTARISSNATVAGGVVDSTAPSAGTAPTAKGAPGPGAGGGAASITTAAQAGATPLGYGGGAGGGGASLNGSNSGAGGSGTPGYCLVITTL